MSSAESVVLGTVVLCTLAQDARTAPVGYECLLERGAADLRLDFDIDPASFADPIDPREPPRRRVSRVTLGGESFEAEALLTEGGSRGFWAPGRGILLTKAPAGAARMSDGNAASWRGRCEETGP